MLNITVVVPTYRRPIDLARCLDALQQQSRPANQVIVVVRDTDTATWDFLRDCQPAVPLQTATIKVPGAIAAMNLGLEQAHGEIIAFTDDDAAPHPGTVSYPDGATTTCRTICARQNEWFLRWYSSASYRLSCLP